MGLLLVCIQCIHTSEHSEMPILNIIMYPTSVAPSQICKNYNWWKNLNIEAKHASCGIPYDESQGFIRMMIAHEVPNKALINCLIHNPPLLRNAMIAVHKQKGLDINDSYLLQELMRPQLPQWISWSAIKNLKIEDTWEFYLHGCCIRARIVNAETYESLNNKKEQTK